jgi:hypothetical protein
VRYLFASTGGSGSTYLIRALSRRFRVGDRPDTVFRMDYPELREATVPADRSMFEQLAHGYRISPEATLEEVLPRYVKHLRRRFWRTAVFNTAAELGLFSELEIPGVVFLVRHPLHALASWAKPERHGALVDGLGGVADERALRHFARRWNAVAAEIRRLDRLELLGGVVRFEHAAADARPLGLGWAFSGLDSSRRGGDTLGPGVETRLHELVRDEYEALYPDWAV